MPSAYKAAKTEIDVRSRRHQAAAVAAGGNNSHPFGFGRIVRTVKLLGGKLEQDANDVVLQAAKMLGALPAATILQQLLLGDLSAICQSDLEALGDGNAQFLLVRSMHLGQRHDFVRQAGGINRVCRGRHRLCVL